MKKMCLLSLMLVFSFAGYAEDPGIVQNGSFEGNILKEAPKWSGTGNCWKGKGTYVVTDREAYDGKHSLHCNLSAADSRGQSSSDIFFLQPGQEYFVSYCMKRYSKTVEGRLSIEFTADKGKGALVCHPVKGDMNKMDNQWLEIKNQGMNILYFEPGAEGRKYTVCRNGRFILPTAVYGMKPVQCRGKLYASGQGDIFFDKIVIGKAGSQK